jgi:tetratricopeptide (TPR) repeat protein
VIPALAIACLLAAAPDPQAPDPHAAGKQLFEQASAEYDQGRFADALKDFASAYQADPVPGFLFNLGQCHRELGNWQLAADFYRRYLEAKPDAKNSETARELLATVESKARQETEVGSPAEQGVVVVLDSAPAAAVTASVPRKHSHAGAWALIGSGAAVAVAGGILGALALDNGDRTFNDPVTGLTEHSLTQAQANTANTFATTGLVLGSVGVAALAGGLAWLLVK